MTNIKKTREEIIYELVLSLNNGNVCYVNDRVKLAIDQYNQLVENKIVKNLYTEESECDCNHQWVLKEYYECAAEPFGKRRGKYVCLCCGTEYIGDI